MLSIKRFVLIFTEHYEEYVRFDSFKRKDQSLSDFINEFEKLHNVVKKRDILEIKKHGENFLIYRLEQL